MTKDIDLTNKIVIVGLNAAGLSTLKDILGLMTDMQIFPYKRWTLLQPKTSLQRDSKLNY